MSRSALFYRILLGFLAMLALTYAFSMALYRPVILVEKAAVERFYQALGIDVVDSGWNALTLVSPSYESLTIVLTSECLGIYLTLVYCVLVLLTPGISARDALRGIAVGVPLLFVANLLRIAVSGIVGVELGPIAFYVVHNLVGSGLMMLLLVALWVDWIYRTLRRDQRCRGAALS